MTARDLIAMSFGNLWRMKLRSALTIAGVVIGIAALVSMMSFGAGLQKNVAESFEAMELFSTLKVLPRPQTQSSGPDTATYRTLDSTAIRQLSQIPGVKSVWPEQVFQVRAKLGEKGANTSVQALPAEAGQWKVFRTLKAGRFFASDTVREAVLQRELLKRLGLTDPDSALGREITLITAKVNLAAVWGGAMGVKGLNPFAEARYTFTISGVLESTMSEYQPRDLIIPIGAAQQMEYLSFSSPFELLNQVTRGAGGGYSSLTLRIAHSRDHDAVRDSIDALGYNTFSFADMFAEARRALMIFDAALGVVGFIALVVASLGIANTLVMSIMERYREIGILKSLGADDRDVRRLFLAESAVIGFLGSVLGLVFGWIITRIAQAIAGYFMAREGVPRMELFDLPWWLISLAIVFGVGVSLLAGLYPSRRATKVDPVQALRHD
ncbi:MAG: ABC transporter permease [Candidatus Zixiibacteriota bacterium]|nr:MAG: ABC transporter permease [candidate division Zixibacteria bacterium]